MSATNFGVVQVGVGAAHNIVAGAAIELEKLRPSGAAALLVGGSIAVLRARAQ
jgi:hypothetical protein